MVASPAATADKGLACWRAYELDYTRGRRSGWSNSSVAGSKRYSLRRPAVLETPPPPTTPSHQYPNLRGMRESVFDDIILADLEDPFLHAVSDTPVVLLNGKWGASNPVIALANLSRTRGGGGFSGYASRDIERPRNMFLRASRRGAFRAIVTLGWAGRRRVFSSSRARALVVLPPTRPFL